MTKEPEALGWVQRRKYYKKMQVIKHKLIPYCSFFLYFPQARNDQEGWKGEITDYSTGGQRMTAAETGVANRYTKFRSVVSNFLFSKTTRQSALMVLIFYTIHSSTKIYLIEREFRSKTQNEGAVAAKIAREADLKEVDDAATATSTTFTMLLFFNACESFE